MTHAQATFSDAPLNVSVKTLKRKAFDAGDLQVVFGNPLCLKTVLDWQM